MVADRTSGPGLTGRRELTAVVVGIVVGAGLTLFAASRVWLVEMVSRPAPLPADEVTHSGGSLIPALPALGLVALACAGGLVATRGLPRRLVGALLGGTAVGIVAQIVPVMVRRNVTPAWPILSLAGALVLAVAAVAVVLHGNRWPVMGSRYSRASSVGPHTGTGPSGSASASGAARASGSGVASSEKLWDALDQGDDPTRDDPTRDDPTRDDPTHGDARRDAGPTEEERGG